MSYFIFKVGCSLFLYISNDTWSLDEIIELWMKLKPVFKFFERAKAHPLDMIQVTQTILPLSNSAFK